MGFRNRFVSSEHTISGFKILVCQYKAQTHLSMIPPYESGMKVQNMLDYFPS